MSNTLERNTRKYSIRMRDILGEIRVVKCSNRFEIGLVVRYLTKIKETFLGYQTRGTMISPRYKFVSVYITNRHVSVLCFTTVDCHTSDTIAEFQDFMKIIYAYELSHG